MEVKALREFDALLQAFLQETVEAESNHLLEKLICEHAQPLAMQIIKARLRAYPTRADDHREMQDLEDISNEVTLQLVKRLREFKTSPAGEDLSDFSSYVAVVAYNACHRYLRQKYPERYRLKNKLRYILTHHKSFALWEGDDKEWLCGLSTWRNQKKPFYITEKLHPLRGRSQVPQLIVPPLKNLQHDSLVHLLASVFDWVGKPVELEDLVKIVAGLEEIKEQVARAEPDCEKVHSPHENFPDLPARLATRQEQLIYLRRLWGEICELPLQQRASLLLGLRDQQGDDIITLLSHLRIASLRQMAEVLAISAEELAGLWNDLPLDDATIAIRLGVTRQQVISLRQSARRRLLRRAKGFGR